MKKFRILLLIICFANITCKTKDYIQSKNEFAKNLVLSPSINNTRNSEGDFIKLKNGKLLFVYTHYVGGTGDDHDPAFLASRYSLDNGDTWSKEDEVVISNEGNQNVMSVSLLRLQNGDIALFYLIKNSNDDCIPFLRISKNETKSWSKPIKCIDNKGYYTLNNDRVVQLKNGRLLMPVSKFNYQNQTWDFNGELYCYYSDDNGMSWNSSKKVPDNTNFLTQEPGLIEMSDGQIMMFIRASGGKQLKSFSKDQGETWSSIETSNIFSPVSPATIEKIPKTNNWVMVWNNNDGLIPEIKDKRTPLTIAISKDEGENWENVKNIETKQDGWFCYTAIHFTDKNNLILAYCSGTKSNNTGLAFTTIKKIDNSWLYKEDLSFKVDK